MKKMTLIFITLSIFASCGKGGSGDGGVKKREFLSPHDPCLQQEVCKNIKNISFDEAMRLMDNSAFYTAPQKGLQVQSYVETTTHVYIMNDNGDFQKQRCDIAFDQTRLLVDFDQKHIYVEEKKDNIKFRPDNEICARILTYEEYQPVLVAKEERLDLDRNFDPETKEMMERLVFKSLELNGAPTLKVSGEIEIDFDIPQEKKASLKAKIYLFNMFDLSRNFFASNVVDHVISQIPDFPSETLEKSPVVSEGVDVSHVDIPSMSHDEILDRTENN